MPPRDWLHSFVLDGTISRDQLGEAEEMASSHGMSVEDALIKLGYVDEGLIGRAKAKAFGYRFVELDGLADGALVLAELRAVGVELKHPRTPSLSHLPAA